MPPTAPTAKTASTTLRCHRCSQLVGESPGPMDLVAVQRTRADSSPLPSGCFSWRCRCGWFNIFKPRVENMA